MPHASPVRTEQEMNAEREQEERQHDDAGQVVLPVGEAVHPHGREGEVEERRLDGRRSGCGRAFDDRGHATSWFNRRDRIRRPKNAQFSSSLASCPLLSLNSVIDG
jgi:hypothetical protein